MTTQLVDTSAIVLKALSYTVMVLIVTVSDSEYQYHIAFALLHQLRILYIVYIGLHTLRVNQCIFSVQIKISFI